jgi:hypothetical protein
MLFLAFLAVLIYVSDPTKPVSSLSKNTISIFSFEPILFIIPANLIRVATATVLSFIPTEFPHTS